VSVTVELGEFALRALAGEMERRSDQITGRMIRAINYYLSDADTDHPGWKYPGFLRGREVGETRDLELTINEDLWGEFEAAAEKQGVSARQLAEHAALYYAAELNAGRVTERILGDIEDERS
jgi:hypothetical protein